MIFNWLNLFAGICYCILGVFIVVYRFFVIPLDKNVAYSVGILMVVYGIYRVLRTVKKLRNEE